MDAPATHPDQELIARAATSRRAERLLVRRLDPFVRAPVRVCLRRWPARKLAGLDEDDLCSEVMLKLFENNAGWLSRWDPARSSLGTYVSWFTRSRLKEHERKELRRLELVPAPVDIESVAPPAATEDPHGWSEARQLALALRRCLKKKMPGEKAQRMIELLYDRALSTEQVVEASGLSPEQISRMRYLIRTNAKACLKELQS